MSQHQDTSASKNTKSTPRVRAPPMGVPDDEILDVAPLSIILGADIDLNQPISIDASASACSNQGNPSSIPSGSTPTTNSKEGTHYTDHVIRDLVTRILNEFVKGVSTPLSQMYPSPKVEQHSGEDDDSSSSEKELAAEWLRSLGHTMFEKGKSVASHTDNASHSEKHDEANVVIDLEDGSSDDQEESLIHHMKPSVSERMKTRKEKFVAELMSARKAKKTAGIGPSKPWSKVEVNKRKVKDDSKPEEDVEEDVPDILPAKKTIVRKSPVKVPAIHLDNISFHLEGGAAKWKFVIQRRVAMERELGKDVVNVKEVMNRIKVVGLLKTVAGFSQCYEGLAKEFIINIPEDISDKNNKEFCKVFVRGRKNEGAGELEVTDNQVCRGITGRQVKVWPVKKHLPVGKLTVKFMFEQIIKHAITNAVKLPIAFPSMICGIILNQYPGILCSNDLPSRRKLALSVHYKLLEGSHVEDIVLTSTMKRPTSKVGAIAEGENIEHANVIHEEEAEAHTSSERSANNDDASGNSGFGDAEEAANSSSTE
ncbi:uncharacterized protein LOC127094950 [Lathyrus oleraceus]|uniref:uncharacterized protein LOC127094950 n=1 Tax=Pisum sativum TaxID=3888 RepID=UPI0021D01886|nr:uncharacterized protein LOC127094950 [Pisum sativum]